MFYLAQLYEFHLPHLCHHLSYSIKSHTFYLNSNRTRTWHSIYSFKSTPSISFPMYQHSNKLYTLFRRNIRPPSFLPLSKKQVNRLPVCLGGSIWLPADSKNIQIPAIFLQYFNAKAAPEKLLANTEINYFKNFTKMMCTKLSNNFLLFSPCLSQNHAGSWIFIQSNFSNLCNDFPGGGK